MMFDLIREFCVQVIREVLTFAVLLIAGIIVIVGALSALEFLVNAFR